MITVGLTQKGTYFSVSSALFPSVTLPKQQVPINSPSLMRFLMNPWLSEASGFLSL